MSQQREIAFRIRAGATYIYLHDLPRGCKGGRYRVHGFVIDVPSYQEKVLVECLSGKDAGLWFTCSPANFARRYEPEETVPATTQPSAIIDMMEKGPGA